MNILCTFHIFMYGYVTPLQTKYIKLTLDIQKEKSKTYFDNIAENFNDLKIVY